MKLPKTWSTALGWVIALALAYQFGLQPLLDWVCHMLGINAPHELNIEKILSLIALVGGYGLLSAKARDSPDDSGKAAPADDPTNPQENDHGDPPQETPPSS